MGRKAKIFACALDPLGPWRDPKIQNVHVLACGAVLFTDVGVAPAKKWFKHVKSTAPEKNFDFGAVPRTKRI